MSYKETIVWHEVIKREPTDDEIEAYMDAYGEKVDYILECPMPDDDDDILIATPYGVSADIACISDGYSLENNGDWDDVIAWAHMPKYKEEQHENKEVN